MSSSPEERGPEETGLSNPPGLPSENVGKPSGRGTQVIVLAVIVVVVLAALVVIILQNQPQTPAVLDPTYLAEGGVYGGIPRDQVADGMFRLGAPDAPTELREYMSFGCGHCANFHGTTFKDLLANEIKDGAVNFIAVPYTDPSSQALVFASATAYCSGEQGYYWEMVDLLFGWLEQYGGSAYQYDRVLEAVQSLGMNQADFETCLSAESTITWLNTANDQFINLVQQYQDDAAQVTGTPTIVINGVPPLTRPDSRSGDIPIDMLRDLIAAAAS